jgi:MraZ protein
MSEPQKKRRLAEGEFLRTVDDKSRLMLPGELVESWGEDPACILSKERPGCLSLWLAADWAERIHRKKELIRLKYEDGRFDDRIGQLQLLFRLFSSRTREVSLGDRRRLLIPEEFLEFLQVEKAGGDVMVVGAGVCIEIWRLEEWRRYLESRMPRFERLLTKLSM